MVIVESAEAFGFAWRQVEDAYMAAYDRLKGPLEKYGLEGASAIKIIESRRHAVDRGYNPYWKPDGTLLIPKEVCEDTEALTTFIALELIRRAYWSNIQNYMEIGRHVNMHKATNAVRIELALLNIAYFEYYAEYQISDEEKKRAGLAPSQIASIMFAAHTRKKIEDSLERLEEFAANGFKNNKERKKAVEIAFKLYSDIVPAYTLYKLHKARRKELSLENTVKLSQDLGRLAIEGDLYSLLRKDTKPFNANKPMLRDTDIELYNKVYAMFANIPQHIYHSSDTEWIAKLLTNAVFAARAALEELKLNEGIETSKEFAILLRK